MSSGIRRSRRFDNGSWSIEGSHVLCKASTCSVNKYLDSEIKFAKIHSGSYSPNLLDFQLCPISQKTIRPTTSKIWFLPTIFTFTLHNISGEIIQNLRYSLLSTSSGDKYRWIISDVTLAWLSMLLHRIDISRINVNYGIWQKNLIRIGLKL